MTSSAIFTPRSLASRPRPARLAQDPTNGGRGETPFLHAFSDNSPAIALYHRMGQGIRRLYVTVLGNHS
jgi:hypothetical protein